MQARIHDDQGTGISLIAHEAPHALAQHDDRLRHRDIGKVIAAALRTQLTAGHLERIANGLKRQLVDDH